MSSPPKDDRREVWTVYRDTTEFPGMFTARRWLAGDWPPVPDPAVIVAPEIESIRKAMVAAGKTCLPRLKSDPPAFVESWI
jgi:hypothetical protein